MKKVLIANFVSLFVISSSLFSAQVEINTENTQAAVKISNGKISLTITKGQKGTIALSYFLDGKDFSAGTIEPQNKDGKKFSEIKSCSVKHESPDEAIAEAVYSQNDKLLLKVKKGSEYFQIVPKGNIKNIRIKMKSDAIVIPDLISEDLVLYPSGKKSSLRIPSDNHIFLSLLSGRSAILTCIWNSEKQKVQILETSKKEKFSSIVLSSGHKGEIWMGINAAKNIWHKVTKKLDYVTPTQLDWNPPFPARWFVTMRKEKGFLPEEDGLSDTWVFVEKSKKKRPSIKHGVGFTNLDTWRAWASGTGGFTYPCNFENGKTYIQPPKFRSWPKNDYDPDFSPIVYPLEPQRKKPLKNTTLPMTAAKKLLGNSLYNKLICVRAKNDKYPATCGVTAKVEKIFYRDAAEKEKEKIKEMLSKMDLFVITVRGRIEAYMEWNRKMQSMLERKGETSPHLRKITERFKKDLNRIEWNYAAKTDQMKTPKYAQTLSEKILKLIDSDKDEEEKEEECKELGKQIRVIGGSQDTNLGKMRTSAKCARRKATMLLAQCNDPETISLLKKIRTETGNIMRERFGMEGK